jgi:hypothetical protein
LIDVSGDVIITVEDFLDLFGLIVWVSLLQKLSHICLDLSYFLINVSKVNAQCFLLLQKTLANEKDFLFQTWRVLRIGETLSFLLEDSLGDTLSLLNLLVKKLKQS